MSNISIPGVRKIFYAVLFLFCTYTSFSQEKFYATTLEPDFEARALLQEQLSQYVLFDFDQPLLDKLIKSRDEKVNFIINIEGRDWVFELAHTSVFSPNFKAVIASRQGEIDVTDQLSISTLKGWVGGDPENTACMTIAESFLDVFFTNEEDIYFITPLTKFTRNGKDLETYVFYKWSDWTKADFCQTDRQPGAPKPSGLPAPEPGNGNNGGAPQGFGPETEYDYCGLSTVNATSTFTTHPCRILQIAADGDHEYVGAFALDIFGAFAAINTMVANIFASEPGYLGTFALSFEISSVRVWIDFSAPTVDVDPYPDNTTGFTTDAQINTFINNMDAAINTSWAGSATPFDLVQIFTGVPICNVGTVPGSLCTAGGCPNAWSSNPDICLSGIPKNVIGFCVPNFTSVAHEIGHSFGAVHPNNGICGSGTPPAQPCAAGGAAATIMCPNFCPDRGLGFDAGNTTTIAGHMNTNGACLMQSNLGSITGPELVCAGQSTTYSILFNYVPPAPFTTAWTVGPGLTVNWSNNGNISVTGDVSYVGATFVEARLPVAGCMVTLRRNFYLNGVPAFDCARYIYCVGGFESFFIWSSLAPGHSISNLQCASTNCGSLNYYIYNLPGGTEIEIFGSGSATGTYMFTYDLTTPCGTFKRRFFVDVKRNCGGGIGLSSSPTETIRSDGQEAIVRENALDYPVATAALSLRPNPANELLYIDIYLPSDQANVSLEILDLSGRTVSRPIQHTAYPKGDHTTPYQLNAMPAGSYLVKLVTDDKVYVSKLVKQ